MELDEYRLPTADRAFRVARRRQRDPGAGPGDRGRLPAHAGGGGVRADGTVRVSSSLMTGCPGVFAGGDMVPAERTVTVGVGHGKRAAREIDAWLRGSRERTAPQASPAMFDMLNLWYFGDAARRQQPELEPGGAGRRVRRSGRRAVRERGMLRGAALPVVRKLLRVRWLPRRLPGGRGDQVGARAALPLSTTSAAPAAGRASSNARCIPSRCSRGARSSRPSSPMDGQAMTASTATRRRRRSRTGSASVLHLPDHTVLADGRTGR